MILLLFSFLLFGLKDFDIMNNHTNDIIKFENSLKLNSEFSKEKAAVDRVIPAVFILKHNKKQYNYNFEHNNTPKPIQELLNIINSFVTLEE